MRYKQMFIVLTMLTLILVALTTWGIARAEPYQVTNTNNSGPGSLRWAIEQANTHPGADTIEFAIPAATDPGCDATSGVCTIQPVTALPILIDDITTIDGYSQDGAAPATDTSPAVILIQIDGGNVTNNGINISSSGNVIRGLAINRFAWNGIGVGGDTTTGNLIAGNTIGLDPSGTVDLGNGYNGVFIGLGAKNNVVGGDEPAERNLISGNEWSGVEIHGVGTSGNTVSGNYIGLTADGLTTRGNTLNGVRIYGAAQGNLIGGDTVEQRNVICGNLMDGVRIINSETTANVISGNYIGVAPDGVTACANGSDGVYIAGGAHDNLIGGDTPGARNVISGNGNDGVNLFGGPDNTRTNTVSGNYIGVDASGLAALPNNNVGILIYTSYENIIGGDSEGERNIISGNLATGLGILQSDRNEIIGNYIGLDASGLAAIPNGANGIGLWLGSNDNTIGGDTAGERNFIAANDYGVYMSSSDPHVFVGDNWIHNNVIGYNVHFESVGNTHAGVYMGAYARNNTVGPGNIIVHNGTDGVQVNTDTAYGDIVTQNVIYDNTGLGVNLMDNGNNSITPPVILSAPAGAGAVTGTACPGCSVELFTNQDDDGEGRYYWGTTVANGVGTFSINVTNLNFPYLTATATDSTDGTSEFSAVFTAQVPVLHETSTKSVDKGTASPGESLTYAITLSNTGVVDAGARLTDTLSSKVTWADQYSASSGTVTWDSGSNSLLWQGTVAVGGSVSVTFQVNVNDDLPIGEVIANEALVNNGADFLFYVHASDVTVVSRHLYIPIVLR